MARKIGIRIMDMKSIIKLGIVVLLLMWLQKCLYNNPRELNVEFVPEMVHSVPFDAFSDNPNYQNGHTLQMPVVGTIARGFLPEYSESKLTEELAGEVLINPLDKTDENIVRGEWVYRTYCQVCHGMTGLGDGPVTKRGVPPPPSLLTDNINQMKDGQLYHIITNGKGNMASYRSQVQRKDRWKVIHYIRAMGN
ncbi:MAG: cytochrome c [Candidatus Marinimicrobia bacterium]|jgi:mono/diheme cytochrome c family protein|nr:cytochrome c [Candidatus Neomarinimicrobiota bacterium]MBT4383196.1 cytochrome c [Candidatus Neomarinimicrobiota bacterium]MBT4636011.1 cytochrome c [Candidatus Neomarinimicrobiota bacterium]MBT4734837.1 cytochrome c [Candidatus Neomarinimicrobiota bacterium]MBT5068495.1 cytochrome c [Candidatus Neomarinimicrobiota bacterium]